MVVTLFRWADDCKAVYCDGPENRNAVSNHSLTLAARKVVAFFGMS